MKLLNMKQAAEKLGKKENGLRAGFKKWGVPYGKIGRCIYFEDETLDSWIKNKVMTENKVN
jgi:hypothetical protein